MNFGPREREREREREILSERERETFCLRERERERERERLDIQHSIKHDRCIKARAKQISNVIFTHQETIKHGLIKNKNNKSNPSTSLTNCIFRQVLLFLLLPLSGHNQ